MDNQRIAELFLEIGNILDIQGANHFRVLAYQKAAQNIENLARELKDVYQQNPDEITKIPGIGKDLAAKIVELLSTGKLIYHEELLKTFPAGLLDILRVRGVGPKKVKLFFSSLQIDSIEKLRAAAESGLLRDLPGMGEKSEVDVLKSLKDYDKHQERMIVSEGLRQAKKIVAYMKLCPAVKKVEYAGSLRRMKETIGDIDILVASKDGRGLNGTAMLDKEAQTIMEYFIQYQEMESVLAQGDTKTSLLLKSGVQVDLRVIDENIFGAALHYFTGSKAHNVTIRDRAKKMGLKINEYGVFKIKEASEGKEKEEIFIAGKTEEELFQTIGLPYILPEMREDRGEVEAALAGTLPTPVDLPDLRGDLHVHSKWSDGENEIEQIARAYREAGFEYIALTDHSPSLKVAHGLTPERFSMQWDEIDEINLDLAREAKEGAKPFTILKGVECDILADGSLDLPDEVLETMDIVVISVHSRFTIPEQEQTERVLKAFQNPYVKIFGHPNGRLINQREPYAIDMERIIDEAVKKGIALEINSQPERLDLFDYYCKMAKDKGAKFTIDSDSHHFSQLDNLKFGIAIAKRGWVEKKDVLNCLSLKDLKSYFKNR